MQVTVIVLGDLGRSPRMQRHALMFADSGFDVRLIGYRGREVFREVAAHERIRISTIPEFQWLRNRRALAPVRQVALGVSLLARLLTSRSQVLFVQNPPALPTLVVTALVAAFSRAKVVIDWHNLTSALARLRFPRAAGLIAPLEKTLARTATAHFAVSRKMAAHLEKTMGIEGVHPLHDLPMRHPPNKEKRVPQKGERVQIMTGTSFTDDEELQIIEDAAPLLDAMAVAGRIPPVTFVVAGAGDRREELERKWLALPLREVRFEFGWFSQHEYQQRMREATLGLSLHRSTSNLDLPMKVSDMIGAATPMLILDYDPVLREMVDERAALFFRDAPELVTAIATVLENLPANSRLSDMRRAAAASERDTWEAAWSRVVLPVIERLASE